MKSLHARLFAAGHRSRCRVPLLSRVSLLLCLLLALAAGCSQVDSEPETGPPAARVETCRDLILLLDQARLDHDGPRGGGPRIEPRPTSMGGTGTMAIFAHPTSEIIYRLPIHPGARLTFMIGLDPDCWVTESDGATFEVLVGGESLLKRHLDPVHNPDHRDWLKCSVDLGRFAGTTQDVVLRTGPGPSGDPAWDWALWGMPQLVSDGVRAPADTAARPHVILISLDTLRRDHLDSCGHRRLTTPHLDRLLDESVFFSAAIAPSHWTMPSHMSVFTSLSPDIHQVTKTTGTARLSEGVPTLAGQLREAGYLTAGFATCGFLKGDMGFDRGFDRYCLRYNNAWRQNRLVRDWIWTHRQRNQFIFLHYFDIHSDYHTLPYNAAYGFETLFGGPEPEKTFSGCSSDGEKCASSYLTWLNNEGVLLEHEERQAISVMYDRGVRQLDFQLAKLVAWLKALGLWDQSLVILFSDHGEEFQEHGKLLHAQLYSELTSVPLIVKLPGGKHGGKRVNTPVEIIDVAPTILSLLDLPVPGIMQGRDLTPLVEGRPATEPGKTMLFSWANASRSITHGEWKLVLDSHGGRELLYNLSDDPGEQQNLIRQKPEVAQRLHLLLKEKIRRDRDIADRLAMPENTLPDGFSEEERKQLELLGYVE